MDFFETQERYRRREMRGWVNLFVRFGIIAATLWLGWLWGHAEQTSLEAEADRVIYENNLQIAALSNELQTLQLQLAESEASQKATTLTEGNVAELRYIVTKQIARGVAPAQIMQSIQGLGKPTNCREIVRQNVAVATPLYAGPESKLTLFEGGLNLHVEGQTGKKAARESPWFDPDLPISVRLAFLNGQKLVAGPLPLETVIPAEGWVLKIRFERADLRGYVTTIVANCAVR